MEPIVVSVRRFSVVSRRTFAEVVADLDREIGHPDMAQFSRAVNGARTFTEMEAVVQAAVGPTDLMEFIRFDVGDVIRKEFAHAPNSIRLVVGNPLIMKEMVRRTPDAASYAPVTILVDKRADGVHLAYDTVASCIADYGNVEAIAVAQDLDLKIEALLKTAGGLT
jgi:uncharacterized protein (DUF302 family)